MRHPDRLTHRGRTTNFTRRLQSAKAATLLDFGRHGQALSLLTARRASSKLFVRCDPRLPGSRHAVPGRDDRLPAGRPGRAPRRARLPMRRSATDSRHIYRATDERHLDGFPLRTGRGKPAFLHHRSFDVRSHQTAPDRAHRDRRASTPAHGEGDIGSYSVRTSGSRPSTSRTVVSLILLTGSRKGARAQATTCAPQRRTGGRRFSLLPEEG